MKLFLYQLFLLCLQVISGLLMFGGIFVSWAVVMPLFFNGYKSTDLGVNLISIFICFCIGLPLYMFSEKEVQKIKKRFEEKE